MERSGNLDDLSRGIDHLGIGLLGYTLAEQQAIVAQRSPNVTDEIRFACRHRGRVIRTDKCDLCGSKGQPFDVLSCEIYGECSITRKHKAVRSCVACEDRTEIPVESLNPAGVPYV